MSTDVGVGQLVEELEQRGDRLPFEIGAFVALEACEGLLQESVRLEADDVRVTAEGSVVVARSAARAEPDEAAKSLVSVLTRLLVAAGPGVPPYLLQLVREEAREESRRDLRHLHDAIEASLIPLNRGASRRVLARLVRESDRPPAPEESIDPQELDAELDELLRDPAARSLEPPPVPTAARIEEDGPATAKIKVPKKAASSRIANPDTNGAAVTATDAIAVTDADAVTDAVTDAATVTATDAVAVTDTATVTVADGDSAGAMVVSEQVRVDSAPPPSSIAVATALPLQAQEGPDEVDEAVTATIRVRFPEQEPETAKVPIDPPEDSSQEVDSAGSDEDRPAHPPPASSAVLESATATTQQWAITPSVPEESEKPTPTESARATKRRGRRTSFPAWLLVLGAALVLLALVYTSAFEQFAPAGSAAPTSAPVAPGTIAVSVDPADAQIFLYIGRGPTTAEGLSVAGPHEFIVFDDGLEPSRAIVPQGAPWGATADGALYELAVQARPVDPSTARFSLGQPLTTPATPDGQSGTVRVITNPPGAKVYRFLGHGPTVEIPAASIQEGHELLVYHPERASRREVVGPSDWRPVQGQAGYEANLDVRLPAPLSPIALDPTQN